MELVYLLACAGLLVAVRGDDTCTINGVRVDESNCPHECCIDDECGSKNECRAVWIIAVIVVGCFVVCAAIVAGGLFAYKRKTTVVTTTEETVQPAHVNYPAPQQAPYVAPQPHHAHAPDYYVGPYPAPPQRS